MKKFFCIMAFVFGIALVIHNIWNWDSIYKIIGDWGVRGKAGLVLLVLFLIFFVLYFACPEDEDEDEESERVFY